MESGTVFWQNMCSSAEQWALLTILRLHYTVSFSRLRLRGSPWLCSLPAHWSIHISTTVYADWQRPPRVLHITWK